MAIGLKNDTFSTNDDEGSCREKFMHSKESESAQTVITCVCVTEFHFAQSNKLLKIKHGLIDFRP